MSVLEDLAKGKSLTGIAIGIGIATLAPVIVPVVAGVVKPAAKAAIKGGILIYDKGREVVAGTVEVAEDLVAEARSELAEEQGPAMAAAGMAGAAGVAGAEAPAAPEAAKKESGKELTAAGEEEAARGKTRKQPAAGEE